MVLTDQWVQADFNGTKEGSSSEPFNMKKSTQVL